MKFVVTENALKISSGILPLLVLFSLLLVEEIGRWRFVHDGVILFKIYSVIELKGLDMWKMWDCIDECLLM